MARKRGRPRSSALIITAEESRQNARVDVTGIPAGTHSLTITRTSPSGTTVAVRGAVGLVVDGETEAIVRDWEVPFNVALVYTAAFAGPSGGDLGSISAAFTMPYSDCEAWLVDLARPTNSTPVTIEAFSPLDFAVPSGVHRVLDRRAPVVTTLLAWTPEGELITLHDTLAERDAMRALYGGGYPVLLRTVPEQGIGNMYLGVTDFHEERFLTLGDRPQRRFTAAVVQVERPDPTVFGPRPPNTYANVDATYGSYSEMLAVVGTYDALAYTFDDPSYSPPVPWLPSDV